MTFLNTQTQRHNQRETLLLLWYFPLRRRGGGCVWRVVVGVLKLSLQAIHPLLCSLQHIPFLLSSQTAKPAALTKQQCKESVYKNEYT